MSGVALAPSAIRVDLGRNSKRFAEPVEITAEQIDRTVRRFGETGRRAEAAGFDGSRSTPRTGICCPNSCPR